MDVTAVVSIIGSVLTFAGVVVTNAISNSKTIYRIEQLEKKQDKHNNVIERMYHVETTIDVLDERQKVANHRIEDLERKLDS